MADKMLGDLEVGDGLSLHTGKGNLSGSVVLAVEADYSCCFADYVPRDTIEPADLVILTRCKRVGVSLLDVPWDRDLRDELPRNDNCPGKLGRGWWRRTLDQIRGVCFHHTRSDSPHVLAKWYVYRKPWSDLAGDLLVGRPSIPYTIWVTQTGEVLLCNDLEEGCWHNENGHENRELSIGLAGDLSKFAPADVQLDAAARVAVWAIRTFPGVAGMEQVWGHVDYTPGTVCPGWLVEASGFWKPRLFEAIAEKI